MTFRTGTAPTGPLVTSDEVTFRYADPDRRLVRRPARPAGPHPRRPARLRPLRRLLDPHAAPAGGLADGVPARAAVRRRRHRGGLRPGEPAAGAGRVRGQVGAGVPRLPAAGLAGRTGAYRARRPRSGCRRATCTPRSRCGSGPRPTPGRPSSCRCWSPTTGRSTRAVRSDDVRGGDGPAAPAPPAPDRAARAGRAGRVVQRQHQLRPGAGTGGAADHPAPGRGRRPGGRDGRQPGRAGRAARAPPAPRPVRRAVPAVRLVLHPRARPAGARLRPVHPDHPVRRATPAAACSRPSRCRRR